MNVIVVDDERIVLAAEETIIKRAMPDAIIHSFKKAKDALEFAAENVIDIAFLDINIKGITGLSLAEKLKEYNAQINIIFCTGYSEYSLDAHELFCSAYLMKPITQEKVQKALENLRYPLSKKIEGFRVQCFGNFEAYYEGQPIKFKYGKTKELFAYLIDRRGAAISTKDMVIALYESEDKESYVRNLRADLQNTFDSLGLTDVLVKSGANLGVQAEIIDCDYYDYLDGKKNLFKGEYMSQFSFSEETLGWMIAAQ